jgi:phospholipase/carboxylesterase
MAQSRDAMLALLTALSAAGVPSSRLVLGGFSQGSMLAMDLALRMKEPPAGLVLWSTTFLTEPAWRTLLHARSGLRVVLSHGTDDPLLPFHAAERLRDALTQAGWRVTWVPFRGAHQIPREAVTAAEELIGSVGAAGAE